MDPFVHFCTKFNIFAVVVVTFHVRYFGMRGDFNEIGIFIRVRMSDWAHTTAWHMKYQATPACYVPSWRVALQKYCAWHDRMNRLSFIVVSVYLHSSCMAIRNRIRFGLHAMHHFQYMYVLLCSTDIISYCIRWYLHFLASPSIELFTHDAYLHNSITMHSGRKHRNAQAWMGMLAWHSLFIRRPVRSSGQRRTDWLWCILKLKSAAPTI